jgi:hypothetical protein
LNQEIVMSQQASAAKSTASTAAAGDKKFFDLHTRGIGYLNRTRWVTIKGKGGRRADTFLCCSVNALHGDADNPDNTLFDCRVSGTDAQQIVQAVMPAVEAKKKVLVGFAIGDIFAHVYERKVKTKGADNQWRETGEMETASLIKGRLIQIGYVKIDDEVVYRIDDGVVYSTLPLAQGADRGSSDAQRRDGTNDIPY